MAAMIEDALGADPQLRCTAHELATGIYESTPAAPVRPGHGDDPAAMLTHRVRELARETSTSVPTSRSARRQELRSRSRAAHLRVVAAAVLALVLGGAGIAVAKTASSDGPTVAVSSTVDSVDSDAMDSVEATDGPEALGETEGTGETAGEPAEVAEVAEVAESATSAEGDGGPAPEPFITPESQASAEATGETGARNPSFDQVLQSIADRRAQAWTDGDAAGLGEVFAAGSAALERDRELVASARDGGYGYVGLTFAVEQVEVRSDDEIGVRVEATLATTAYSVISSGAREARPATSQRVEILLVESAGRWLIQEIGPVST